jgi:hypothetical protein
MQDVMLVPHNMPRKISTYVLKFHNQLLSERIPRIKRKRFFFLSPKLQTTLIITTERA